MSETKLKGNSARRFRHGNAITARSTLAQIYARFAKKLRRYLVLLQGLQEGLNKRNVERMQ